MPRLIPVTFAILMTIVPLVHIYLLRQLAVYFLRDIFLDGNTFASSHSVAKKIFVSDFVIGASVVYSNFKFSYAHVLRTSEFNGEPEGHDFGSISLSYTY
jgi:lipid A 3-O-deacylase